MQYSNFDIRIEAIRDGSFTLKAESDSQGEVSETIDADWIVQNLYEGLRRIDSRQTDAQFLTDFGAQLLSALFPTKVNALLQRAIGEARTHANGGVRVRLLIDDATLEEIPWELGYSIIDGHFLAAQTETPFVRYLSIPSYKRSLLVSGSMQILVVSTRGNGLPDALKEEKSIRKALEAMQSRVELTFAHEESPDGRITQDVMEHLLTTRDFHVLHFIGHGYYRNGTGVLEFDDGPMDQNSLGTLLSRCRSLSLVVLNSCEGAKGSMDSMLSGTAAALVRKGMPAVIAMRYEIFDSAALLFAKRFYQALFMSKEAGRVDYAMSVARQALVDEFSGEREIATPVLLTHTDASVLFLDRKANPLRPQVIQTFRAAAEQQALSLDATNPEVASAVASERKIINRKLLVGVATLRGGLLAAGFAMLLSLISFLDVLGLETWAEFFTTSIGDRLTEHSINSNLEIVALPKLSIAEQRSTLAKSITELAQVNPAVIALDGFFSVDEGTGEFSKEVEAGNLVASAMSTSIAGGAKVIISPDLKNNMIPKVMETAGVHSAHNCTQGSLGIFRAVPLFINTKVNGIDDQDQEQLQSNFAFSAAAVRLFHNDDRKFKASVYDQRTPFRSACSLVTDSLDQEGTSIGSRFLRFTPLAQLKQRVTDYNSDTVFTNSQFSGKLVVIGFRNDADRVSTLSDTRDGFLWQADAINNLLNQTHIVRMPSSYQFLIMLVLGAISGFIRLSRSPSRTESFVLLLVSAGLLLALCALIYSSVSWVLNPAYLVLSLVIGWIICGTFKKRFAAHF